MIKDRIKMFNVPINAFVKAICNQIVMLALLLLRGNKYNRSLLNMKICLKRNAIK